MLLDLRRWWRWRGAAPVVCEKLCSAWLASPWDMGDACEEAVGPVGGSGDAGILSVMTSRAVESCTKATASAY